MILGRKKLQRNLHNIFLPTTTFFISSTTDAIIALKLDKSSVEKHYVNRAKLNTIAI